MQQAGRDEPQDFDRVLTSMCTEPHPEAREAAERFLATNPGDPGTYATVSELEDEAIEMLGTVTGLTEPAGYITSGGTEANVQAVRIARNRADTGNPNIVAPTSAHFSFRKAAEVLGVELRTAPTVEHRTDIEAAKRLVDTDTVAVVGVAGSTEYGAVDPIPALADIATDAGALCHVDAAWGGFYLPFTDHAWQFAHADIDTMTIDPHKAGRAAVPAGGLLARNRSLFDELAIDTPYLESDRHAQRGGCGERRRGDGGALAGGLPRAVRPRDDKRRVGRRRARTPRSRRVRPRVAARRSEPVGADDRRTPQPRLARLQDRRRRTAHRLYATRHPLDASFLCRGSRLVLTVDPQPENREQPAVAARLAR